MCDLWWTKWGWGRFLLSASVSPAYHHSTNAPQSPSSIIWGWYNRPVLAAVPSGLSLTPLILIIIIIIIIILKKSEPAVYINLRSLMKQ
jgi:hypothetical protein